MSFGYPPMFDKAKYTKVIHINDNDILKRICIIKLLIITSLHHNLLI